MKNTILLIEDDDRLRRTLQLVLQGAGYEVRTAEDGREGIATWQEQQPEAVLTDLKMKPVDGLAVLAFGKKHSPQTPIIFLTAFGTVKTAVSAMKDGAFDYLTKPVDNNALLSIIAEAMSTRQPITDAAKTLIGTSAAMMNVLKNINFFAVTDSSVLISGESGTGKELAARAIHQASAYPEGPFIRLNCAAIPAELMESELFGHVQGAFTGAVSNRDGAFSKADGGTLFLDEIGDLPLVLQAKILHAVEDKTITAIGSNTAKTVKVKILSASNQDLAQMIAAGTFRRDLYYRLNRVHLHMPAVRERKGDIDLLLDHFLQLFCRSVQKNRITFSRESLNLLRGYPWLGNVREIKNVVERAVLTCEEGDEITPAHLPSSIRKNTQADAQQTAATSTDLNEREQQLIVAFLQPLSDEIEDLLRNHHSLRRPYFFIR